MYLTNSRTSHPPFNPIGLGLILTHERTSKKVCISALTKNGSAAQAGIKMGDIVIAIDDTCFNPIERAQFRQWQEAFLPIPENAIVHIIVQKLNGEILEVDCKSTKTVSFLPLRCFFAQLKSIFFYFLIDPLKPVGIGWNTKRACFYVNQKTLPSDDDIDEMLQ